MKPSSSASRTPLYASIVVGADDTDDDREADDVRLFWRRSKGDERRSGRLAVSGLFRFREIGLSWIDLPVVSNAILVY